MLLSKLKIDLMSRAHGQMNGITKDLCVILLFDSTCIDDIILTQ